MQLHNLFNYFKLNLYFLFNLFPYRLKFIITRIIFYIIKLFSYSFKEIIKFD
jgi:hypothetical protein